MLSLLLHRTVILNRLFKFSALCKLVIYFIEYYRIFIYLSEILFQLKLIFLFTSLKGFYMFLTIDSSLFRIWKKLIGTKLGHFWWRLLLSFEELLLIPAFACWRSASKSVTAPLSLIEGGFSSSSILKCLEVSLGLWSRSGSGFESRKNQKTYLIKLGKNLYLKLGIFL